MDKETLDRYVSEGWLISQKHPSFPLSIYNYSQSVQYGKKWDEVTLACRGLIVDSKTGKVIIKPFPKFFNYEEIPNEVPWDESSHVQVQKKMDGSLGILFKYQGEWVMATRGSFTSVQAKKGLEIIKSKYDLTKFIDHVAYLVEIVYPDNRIVVDFGKEEKIFFLSTTPNLHFSEWEELKSSELNWATSLTLFKSSDILEEDIVETKTLHDGFDHLVYEELKSMNTPNEEGFVLRFYPSNFRCKIKFEDYVALHRIVTQVSSYDIWENLKNHGKLPEAFLKNVPDEFYEWVKGVENEVSHQFGFLKSLHAAHVNSVLRYGLNSRKLMAAAFMSIKDPRISTGVLFLIADEKDPDSKIWDMVKPEYSRPFANKIEIQ
jgi:RNA ligase